MAREKLLPLLYAFVVWFALIGLLHLPFLKDHVMNAFVHFTSHAAYWFGRLLFIPVELTEVPILSVGGYRMRVVMECTAYNYYLFALVLVFFSRWPMKLKWKNFGIFLLIIFVFNNLRFIIMGYVGRYQPDLFDIIHDTLWNILFGFIVFVIWVWFDILAQKGKEAKAVSQET